MRRSMFVLALSAAVIGTTAVSAMAGVDDSPNATPLTAVTCPETGLFLTAVFVPSANAIVGLDVEGKAAGVAKSLYVTDSSGLALAPLFDRPGRGLDGITVWCFWQGPGSPTGYVGGDVLFRPEFRG